MTTKKGAEAPTAAKPPLIAVLSQLTESRQILNELDDQIADAIRVTEQVLRAHLGTRIAIVTKELSFGNAALLSFTKIGGKWCLAVEKGVVDTDEEDFSKTPLLSASREIRAAMFTDGFVEALIRQAHNQIEKQVVQRRVAIKNAHELLVTLSAFVDKSGKGPDPDPEPENSDDDISF